MTRSIVGYERLMRIHVLIELYCNSARDDGLMYLIYVRLASGSTGFKIAPAARLARHTHIMYLRRQRGIRVNSGGIADMGIQ